MIVQDVLLNLLSIQQALNKIKKLHELAFFISHQTKSVIDYDRAIVWSVNHWDHPHVLSVSGVTQLDRHSDYQIKFDHFISLILKSYKTTSDTLIIKHSEVSGKLVELWPDNLSDKLLLYFFKDRHQRISGGMILSSKDEFNEQTTKQLEWLVEAYQEGWQRLAHPSKLVHKLLFYFTLKRAIVWAVAFIALLLMLVRVPETTLAPASIIAKDPFIVTVPMEGVIEKIEVFPDQTVVAGDLLFSMDKRDLKNANELAKRELATAMAKYKTAIQSGFEDVKKRAEIKVLQAQISEKELEVDYTSHLLQEADVKAEVAGIIVLDNKNRWIGKPVSTGENIMQIADSNRVEIEISLPVDHAIFFHPGDKVKLFLNADPLNPILATIEYSSFEAAIVNSNILAYQIIASIDRNQSAPRIGSQGTAKIIGDNVSLFYYLFRKPISSFRQFTGL